VVVEEEVERFHDAAHEEDPAEDDEPGGEPDARHLQGSQPLFSSWYAPRPRNV